MSPTSKWQKQNPNVFWELRLLINSKSNTLLLFKFPKTGQGKQGGFVFSFSVFNCAEACGVVGIWQRELGPSIHFDWDPCNLFVRKSLCSRDLVVV